jgi:calcineurin-like phosphoesterase family protein
METTWKSGAVSRASAIAWRNTRVLLDHNPKIGSTKPTAPHTRIKCCIIISLDYTIHGTLKWSFAVAYPNTEHTRTDLLSSQRLPRRV